MKVYMPGNDLFVFDMGVPRQHVGWEDYKKDWQDFLAMIPGPIKFDLSDLSVTTDGTIGYGHCIQHVSLDWHGWHAHGYNGPADGCLPQNRWKVADRTGACVGADRFFIGQAGAGFDVEAIRGERIGVSSHGCVFGRRF